MALTVLTTDDPTLPVLTFRMWVLGVFSCVLLSFLNQFFWYRTEPLTITAISAQIAVVPLGRLMAAKITDRVFLKGKRWEFTLNPGPFNVKEHVLITIFANSGAGSVDAILIVTVVKVFYKQNITFFVSLIVIVTTQVSNKSRTMLRGLACLHTLISLIQTINLVLVEHITKNIFAKNQPNGYLATVFLGFATAAGSAFR